MRFAGLAFALCLAACNTGNSGGMGGDLGPAASCDPNPCAEANRTTCQLLDGHVACLCDPGTHEDNGACTPDTTCTPTTCGGHGACSTATGAIACMCDAGYTGTYCNGCDSGWYSDGKGGCTMNPCQPSPCGVKQICAVQNGKPVCSCQPGTHDDHGMCVPDTTCMALSCNGHGMCNDTGGVVMCTCATGFAGTACENCAPGYHDDGAGGCTMDPCTPNPCTTAHQTVCSANGASASCACDAGYHLAGASCVVDDTCTASSCDMHGTCSLAGGVASCACAAGYQGATCATCASGYHDDGAGGCTNDPCTPNPCTMANKTVCSAMGASVVCGCVAGYHSDGVGGCTNDPCTPNPCAATNQACRVVNNAAQCFTPPCDDHNPCTTDTVVGGNCMHANLGDGTACSTTLCQVGQTCTGGVCGGGSARVCNDGNPCTKDSCDAVAGCQAVNDDTLVPDDGVFCTVDTCTSGAASHTATDAKCDDGSWCTGVEKCQPGAGADGKGCVATAVPKPPALTPNGCSSYSCSDAQQAFVLTKAAVGTVCDDGDFCTSNDRCRADGACAGAALASCPAPVCSSTTNLASVIDIEFGNVVGTVTMGGAPLPATSTGGSNLALYLVAQDTGAEHYIDTVQFQYATGGVYNLYSGATYATRLLPGVYDLWYERLYNSQYNYVSSTYPTDNYANGRRVLRTGVVIGTGVNQLDIDLPSATVTGTITMAGAALPTTSTGGSNIALYLVAKDTGAEHYIDTIQFQYATGGVYNLYSGGTYSTRLLPGTYDLWYERLYDSQYNYVSATYPTDNYANGRRVLQSNLVITSGANTVDIDLPSATVTGTLTMGGAALPTTSTGGSNLALYLVAKDTKAEHYIDTVQFQYATGGVYNLYSGGTYSTRLLPGAYELWYERLYNSQYNYVSATYPTDNYTNGRRVLDPNVVITSGANTLNIDLPSATVTGTLTMAGAPLPTTSTGGSNIALYLVAKDTGAEHYLDTVQFQYATGGVYNLYSGGTYSTRLLPGTYDLWYERLYNSQYNYVSATYPTDNYANGRRVIVPNVVIASGANTLDIDLPSATVTGTVTLNGSALPATSTGGSNIALYFVAQDTKAEHYVDTIQFQYATGGVYNLYSGGTYSTRLLPGTYDVWYERLYNSQYNYVSATYATDNYSNGRRVLTKGVVVAPGANVIDIDLPARTVAGSLTVGNQAPPTTSTGGSNVGLYLVARDTGAEHYIDTVQFQYATGGIYTLYSGTSFTTRLLPGAYDLWYERLYNSQYNYVSATYPTDDWANGRRILNACVLVP